MRAGWYQAQPYLGGQLRAAEAMFTSAAAEAARVPSPAATITAPCWLDKEKGVLSDFG